MQPWMIMVALATGAIGGTVGHRKGHPVWGFTMGFLLSVIGIAIVAWSKPAAEKRAGG